MTKQNIHCSRCLENVDDHHILDITAIRMANGYFLLCCSGQGDLALQQVPFWPQPWYNIARQELQEACYCGNPPQNHVAHQSFGPILNRHRSRMANYANYVHPYAVPSRNEYPRGGIVKVPGAYACQTRAVDRAVGCPVFNSHGHESVHSILVSTNIQGEQLHVTYNWLVSIFERYPGYRDLHITPGFTGAVVSFHTEFHTKIARNALDGFWITPTDRLSVRFVHSSIYKYMHQPGINLEYFVI